MVEAGNRMPAFAHSRLMFGRALLLLGLGELVERPVGDMDAVHLWAPHDLHPPMWALGVLQTMPCRQNGHASNTTRVCGGSTTRLTFRAMSVMSRHHSRASVGA